MANLSLNQVGGDLTKLKEGDVLDLGGQYGKYVQNPQGGFSPYGQPNAALPLSAQQVQNIGANFGANAATGAASGSASGNPASTNPASPASSGTSLLPSGNSSSGVVTAPASQPNAGGLAPGAQPGVGIAAAAYMNTPPTPPSMSQILSTSNIPQMQQYVSQLQQTQQQLVDAQKHFQMGVNGQGEPQGIVDSLTNENAKNAQIQLDGVNEALQLASSNLSASMTWTQMVQQAQGTDYQNATQAYNDEMNRAVTVQQLYNSAATQQQNYASGYLNSLANMVQNSPTDWATIPDATKATINMMELQAGWPTGTLETFAKTKPGANILSTINGVDPTSGNATVSFVYSGADGKPGMMQTVVTNSKPASLFSPYSTASGSSSSSGNGYTGSILQGTSLDPQAKVGDILNNPQQMQTLVAAMTSAEGGPSAAGASANNPLDLKFNADMAKLGASDSGIQAQDGGTFAAFPDQASASKAYQSVLGSSAYKGLTLDQALQKWSGYSAPKSGSGNSNIDSWVTQIQNGNATMAQVPNTGMDKGLKDAVAQALSSTDQTSYSPLAAARFTTAANRIVSNYVAMPAYQLTAGGQLYLGRINAAMQTPGSISDQDLLDSLTKLNTGGNAISDAQVSLITGGQSFADSASVWQNKLKNGGVLSDSQRQQVQKLASAIFKSYQKAYQPVYEQATAQLQAAGIPKPFWTIPDLNTLTAQSGSSGGSSATSSSTDQYTSALDSILNSMQ